ncbi:DUF6124 family protein [Pseudomonas sp. TH15]|uniref:DUF6124 family protein n=1 Tax=Pseudomonas sp. TH15 TaxID=2796381 RepID=UPI0019134879|nr:DUF6124 family protein [Pseudomonas sp. TH15]MBK5511702.1 hypothetical protein [Pseudomonas sp. TH15]
MSETTTHSAVTDPISPYKSSGSRKLHEAAELALDHYLLPAATSTATPYSPSSMFMVNPQTDTESLLANACESLASATVMLGDFAGTLDGPNRHTLQGIAQVVMLGELAVNQALDNVELKQSVSEAATGMK